MSDFATELTVELPPAQATLEGRRRPDAQLIYSAGQGPRGATSSASFRILGTYATVGALPSTGQKAGDAYKVTADGFIYVWNAITEDYESIGALAIGVQSSDGSVEDMLAMTQAEYDALGAIDPKTFYIIKP